MRFVMINLLIVFLLLFGIGYLAFGHDGTLTTPEPHAYRMGDISFEAYQELLKTNPEATHLEHQRAIKDLFGEFPLSNVYFLDKIT